ncbi:L-rhamnose mutarotase [Kineococcus rhizosphaerae]|uniref:L-rhamnose mutarotase n=1 Tax=Kineococcus rhizosphaerae TaxID=559628 RepID=A0A2T0R235_9ACTN|nr:L-rhamnose mutarotase [Kineococcus rhizosphaerae]PRY13629.1 L-rhamnose mutarotase [Kineococcus rhizosphaerae]
MTERACFLLHLRPETVQEYLTVHSEVWPEMLDALTRTGWRNYSLFLRAEDGLVVGYCETDDFEATTAAMEREEVSARWEATMARFFAPARGPAAGGDRPRERLVEYFHLD